MRLGFSIITASTLAIISLLGGCRSLSPSAKQATHTTAQPPTSGTFSEATASIDTTAANQPRLLPLRAYMDEIARRQATIESRLDTISRQLESLRQLVEARIGEGKAPIEAEIIPGETKAFESNRDSTGGRSLQPPKQVGVILPDTTVLEHPTRQTAAPRRARKAPARQSSIPSQQLPSQPSTRKSKLDHQFESRQFDSAMTAFRSKQYRTSIELLTKLIEHSSPRKGEYHYWRGLAAFMSGDAGSARSDADIAAKLLQDSKSPLRPDVLYLLAEVENDRGNAERARQLLRTILEQFPQSNAALLARRKLQLLMVSK